MAATAGRARSGHPVRMSERPARPTQWAWFFAWFAVGATYALSILGAATIGIFVLPVAVAATVILAKRPGSRRSLLGLVSGLSLPLFYVAYLNRSGPGTVCNTLRGGGEHCSDQWNPWPWFAVATVLFLAGFAIRSVKGNDEHGPTT